MRVSRKVQRSALIAGLVFLLACIGVAVWRQWPATPVKTAKPVARADARAAPAAQTAQTPEKKAPVRQVYNSSSTLGDLSRYRGQKLLLEQQVRIAELEQRLKELSTPKRAEIVLPDLLPPRSAAPAPAPAETPKRGPVVVSVQGVGGALSATIRTSDGGRVTVRHGGSFQGGVLSVTRRGVSVRKNGKVSAIPFE